MDEENKKINLESFFKRVNSVERIANSALSRANSNLGINNNQKSLIESLSISIEAMQTKIRDIANYIIVEKKLEADREEDRRLEAEDAEQKRQMTERAAAMGETGPQKESVKPAESQGGGGSFLGGLIKTLGGLMVGGFALKYIGPVLLPKLLLLAKTKLFPLIGAGLKTAVTSSFKFLGGLVTKLFSPLTTAPIIGKIFKGIKFASPFLAVGGFLGSKILDFFSKGGKGGGDTGVSSDSNMGATNSTVETDMTDTLKKEGLVEDQKNDGGKEETNEEIEEGGGKEEINEKIEEAGDKKEINTEYEEFDKQVNELKKQSDIAKETGNTDISTELKKEASGGNEELANVEVGKKSNFDTYVGADGKTYLEGNRRNIDSFNSASTRFAKVKRLNFINIFRKQAGLPNIDPYAEGVDIFDFKISNESSVKSVTENKNLDSGAITPGKRTESFTIEKTNVEPIDLSLKQNLETTDKLVNTVTYESGIDNRDQNSSVLVQSKPAQTTIASIKKTSSPVAFIKSNKNKFLSINETELPPEVARMIT